MKQYIVINSVFLGAIVLVFQLVFSLSGLSQNLTQTIKGMVSDLDSQVLLPGATIMVIGTDPVLGTVTDADGNFRLTGIPVGRYSLKFSYVGYEPTIRSEVLVLSGKEVILQVFMKESVVNVQQVEVKAYSNKEQATNAMAMISARQLTMEEASRYAGGIDDPSRLASSFAGVAGSLSSNAIVIRGNAPKGLLWRMEGIEIPNPSHFANVTTFGGGGITALSSQMLTTSDFFTGAFPAEYGNALSGVFDMKMRTGNNEKREHTIKAGIIGIDFATEGPFVKGKKASYLFNYRYSTLALISPLLPENARGIRYQDFAMKINFPLGKLGTVSFWGLLSSDATGSRAKEDSTEWQYYQDIEEDKNLNRMGVLGINHKVILSEKTWLNASAAVTGNYIYWNRKRLQDDLVFYPKDEIAQNDRKYTVSLLVNHKFGPGHANRSGLIFNKLTYDVLLRQAPAGDDALQTYTDEKDGSNLVQIYSQSRWEVSPRLTANAGLHAQFFTLNKNFTLEPRASIKWKLSEKHSLSFAYGLHSRLEPIGYYLARQTGPAGTTLPNKELGMTRAHHMVMAFEASTGNFSRLRIEPFYQRLFDVPVIDGTSFSMSNLEMDWFFNDSLCNRGKGNNIGLDITLERFLHNGYYYLMTLSLFDSKYTGGDGIERNARFNKNYVANILFGKEWKIGRNGSNSLGINWKFSVLGGDRISPVDQAASILAHDVVYHEDKAFSKHKPTVYYLDFTASWQRNKPRYSSTWSFQFVNLLFQKEFYGHRYNFRTHTVEELKEVVMIPNVSYRIDF
ncbi:MAG: TonB-dependent receptor [Bacteroidales bacterium]|nr:TonB-dependent receptor [Bacteroidales bacterium]